MGTLKELPASQVQINALRLTKLGHYHHPGILKNGISVEMYKLPEDRKSLSPEDTAISHYLQCAIE